MKVDAEPAKTAGEWGVDRTLATPFRPDCVPRGARGAARARVWTRVCRGAVLLAGALLLIFVAGAAGYELRTSRLQARVLSRWAAGMTFTTAPGPSTAIRYPPPGPYDLRFGYARLPSFIPRLERAGYAVDAQARSSPFLLTAVDLGLYPIYREKPQAGLRVVDQSGQDVFRARFPEQVYRTFDDIPPVVVRTVLYLENRELLDPQLPYLNPAIEWDRLARAAGQHLARQLTPSVPRMGGSTLATQIEKFRHSPGGRTPSPGDKVRQILSASVRAYLDGPVTLARQRALITDYLNALPLAALPGYGEVTGLGDGLWAWFGSDPETANARLAGLDDALSDTALQEAARTYREVVTLLVANRRPSDYLLGDSDRLARETEEQFDGLRQAGIISASVARLARRTATPLRRSVAVPPVSFPDRKAATRIRAKLARTLGVDNLYALDRLDLTVAATVNHDVQQAVVTELDRLGDPGVSGTVGLDAPGLLDGADPDAVVYSLVLYERKGDADLLRLQADNLDQPLDVSESTKLELGSTAKLRTLVTYLAVLAELHAAHAGGVSTASPRDARRSPDPLTRWAFDYLDRVPGARLPALLQAGLDRRYSASPAERFITGDAVHTFVNFDPEDNDRVLTVREAFRRSVNLVFIRLIRDLAQYHVVRLPDWSPTLFTDASDPRRARYLQQFAERESETFVRQFSETYRGLTPAAAVDRLVGAGPHSPRRLAVIHRGVYPTASRDAFAAFLRARVTTAVADDEMARLYEVYGADRLSLADRGALAGAHPLELWLVGELVRHDGRDTRTPVPDAVSRDAYGWLFRTRRLPAQNQRIRAELEREAFEAIHRRWARLGYPFDRLVPSLATAIGSSGDTPAALAELVGIVRHDGRRAPRVSITSLRFGAGTPFDTVLSARPTGAEQVLDPEVAAAARAELIGVVEEGTGRRAAGAVVLPDGTRLVIGGKTGTGDNRIEVPRRGRPDAQRVLNRTATFTFFLGDRLHGTLTAYVAGPEAGDYRFTSALPVQVLRHLVPTLAPLLP